MFFKKLIVITKQHIVGNLTVYVAQRFLRVKGEYFPQNNLSIRSVYLRLTSGAHT